MAVQQLIEQSLLVGGWPTPSEKYESQLGWFFPIYGKIKFMFQATNQFRYVWIFLGQLLQFQHITIEKGRSLSVRIHLRNFALLRRGLRGVTNEESHFGHRGNPKWKFIHLVIRLRYLNMYGKHEKNMGKPHSSSFSIWHNYRPVMHGPGAVIPPVKWTNPCHLRPQIHHLRPSLICHHLRSAIVEQLVSSAMIDHSDSSNAASPKPQRMKQQETTTNADVTKLPMLQPPWCHLAS